MREGERAKWRTSCLLTVVEARGAESVPARVGFAIPHPSAYTTAAQACSPFLPRVRAACSSLRRRKSMRQEAHMACSACAAVMKAHTGTEATRMAYLASSLSVSPHGDVRHQVRSDAQCGMQLGKLSCHARGPERISSQMRTAANVKN